MFLNEELNHQNVKVLMENNNVPASQQVPTPAGHQTKYSNTESMQRPDIHPPWGSLRLLSRRWLP